MSDHASLTEALRNCLGRACTFAAFRVPGRPVQLWAQRSPEVETVDAALLLELNAVFLLAPFALAPERVPFIRSDIDLLFGDIGPDIKRIDECSGGTRIPVPPTPATDKAEFLRNVAAAHAGFAAHRFTKVVLSRTLDVPFDVGRTPELFVQAITAHPDAFVALVHTPDHGLWLGASPERLVAEDEDHVRVDALAGTLPAAEAPERASAWGGKERVEQLFVTQHVMDTFVQLDLRGITARGPDVMRAGNVAHLRTIVEGDLGGRTLGELVVALHPTPAICGTPTAAAQAFIRGQEGHDRGLYSGFWGPWSADGPTDLFVNIRCMRLAQDHARLFVGAGITADSDAEHEWTETEHKAALWPRLMEQA